MTTRTEKRLIVLANKRERLKRLAESAERRHQSSDAFRALQVEATRQLLEAEMRKEKRRA